MENLADISEPQVPPNEQKIYKFNLIQVSMREKQYRPMKLNKPMEI